MLRYYETSIAVIIHRNDTVFPAPKYAICRIDLFSPQKLVILVDNFTNVAILKVQNDKN